MPPSTPPRSPSRTTTANNSVYIVRHGERADHVDPYWKLLSDTPYDPPLTEQGMRQARFTGAHLGHTLREAGSEGGALPRRWVIYSSPFLRCVQTAQHLARSLSLALPGSEASVLPVRVEPGLGEWHNDAFFPEECPPTLARTRMTEAAPADSTGWPLDQHYIPKHELALWGESSDEMAARLKYTLQRILDEDPDPTTAISTTSAAAAAATSPSDPPSTIILVTHACGVQALVGWVEGSGSGWGSTLMPSYCSLTKLQEDPEGRWSVLKRARTAHLMG